MKKSIISLVAAAAVVLPVLSAPRVEAGGPRTRHYGGWVEKKCWKEVYREEYIPGTGPYDRGRVDYVYDKVRIPCRGRRRNHHHHHHHYYQEEYPNVGRGKKDDNSCVEGAVLGGIGGAGLGAALSRGDGRLWAIPLGIVGGSMVGCQIDGG